MKRIDSYLVEKLIIDKDVKPNKQYWGNDNIMKIMMISGIVNFVDSKKFKTIKDIINNKFFENRRVDSIGCYMYSKTSLPDKPIWKPFLNYISDDKDKFNEIYREFTYNASVGKRNMPNRVYYEKFNGIEYVFLINEKKTILKININQDSSPQFNMYFKIEDKK